MPPGGTSADGAARGLSVSFSGLLWLRPRLLLRLLLRERPPASLVPADAQKQVRPVRERNGEHAVRKHKEEVR